MDNDNYEDGNEEEEEEDEDFVSEDEEEECFDISRFVGPADDINKDESIDDNVFEMEAASPTSRKQQEEEEDPEKLEEKLKKLEEVFSCVPRVLIKRVLNREDVKGDLDIASQRLQEFQDMENPQDLFKPTVAAKPSPARKPSGGGKDFKASIAGNKAENEKEDRSGKGNVPREGKPESSQGRRRKRQKNNGNGNEALWEQREVDENEAGERRGNQVYPDRGARRGGRMFGRTPRGGPRWVPRGRQRGAPRGGFVPGQRDNQEYRDYVPQELGYGFSGGEYTPPPLMGRGNWRERGNHPKPKPRGRGYRGRGNNFQNEDHVGFPRGSDPSCQEYGQYQFTQRGRGRDQFSHARGRGGQAPRGRRDAPVYLSDLAKISETRRSYDDLTFGDFEGGGPNRRGQRNRGRSGGSGDMGSNQRGMRRAQSLSDVADDRGADRRQNEEDESQFEPNKLLVCGLSESTTDDGVLNFIEAMSGEEVKEIAMPGKGKALVTMAQDITNFSKIKAKGEKRGLDSAQVSIERVPVCTSILVSGISHNTTHDAIALYFESPRNHGGPVESVLYKPKSGRAVVVFEDPRDMERVLARQEETPHALNKAQLSVKLFHELLEDGDDIPEDSGGLGTTADDTDNTPVSQRSEPKAQELHMVVDPDVMEYVTTTSLHDELKTALATKKSEINWKPNSKTAVVVYRGDDKSDSWQSDCIEEVQSYLGKFAKRDVKVDKDFWEAVKAQLSSIRACFGVDPPLVKPIDESSVTRIVSLSSDAKDFEEKLTAKLEDVYREEIRKTYLKKKEDVPIERLILLKKIKFVENLQEKNKELEIKLDTEAEEIYFEGPQPQFMEATMKFHKQISGMVEKKVNLSESILEVLSSDQGSANVKCELEKNNVEAVFVIDNEARVVGTSSAHADKAEGLVKKLTLEEKVRVDEKSQYLLKTPEWRQLCEQLNDETAVRVHRNNWNDTYVAGFRDDVTEAMKKLTAYLDNNCIREEKLKCPSKIVRRYLSELRQDDLRSIEAQLADFEVKIQTGKGEDDFVISGNKEGLQRVKRKLDALADGTESETFDVRQPGLRKHFASGKGDRLVKSVEKDHACAIHVQTKQGGTRTRAEEAAAISDSSSGDNKDDDEEEGEEEEMEAAVGTSVLGLPNGHKISWKPGNIETEQAHILVSSEGACHHAIIKAGGLTMKQSFVSPRPGDITVTAGFHLACNHVIHSNCCQWDGVQGELVLRGIVQKCLQKGEELGGTSIAFPVIGAGKLNFPPDLASKFMLEEAIDFCQANPSSTVKDIRFVVFQQDQALITAFRQEMANLQSKHKPRHAYAVGRLFEHLRSKYRLKRYSRLPEKPTDRLSVEVSQGNLCLEKTNAIVNINSKDMNMEKAGALSKAVKQASGPGVQDECNQLGHQLGGSAVMTSGGNLTTRHIIHLIPDTGDKNHLQQCVEKCLNLAEASGIQSISFPAIGTGAFHISAVDSANLIFQALANCSASFNNIRKVRIVIYEAPMLQAFQQEQQRHPLFSNQGVAPPRVSKRGVASSRVSKEKGVSKEGCLSIEVINADLTKEKTDAILNINSKDMNMNNAGELSKAILKAGGPLLQQECTQLGQQTAGAAVMTAGGGSLAVPHIIHIIPGSSDKQHLQACLEAGLRLADTHNLTSISIPSVGTGGYGLSAADSAQMTFQALKSFSASCKNVRKVRVVVFQAQMMQEFLQAQQAGQDVDEPDSDSSSEDAVARQPRTRVSKLSVSDDHCVTICVTGKDKTSVGKAVDSLKKGFSEACTTQKVENETVSKLSKKQIEALRRKAKVRDVRLEIEVDVDRIVVRGEPTEVPGMVGEIWSEINERNKKIQEEQQALLVSMNTEWSYEIHGVKMVFGPKTNAKIEMAYIQEQPTVQISLLADEFVIDLKAKTGRGQRNGETITLSRKLKGASEEGIPLPSHWAPMPASEKTVYKVQLLPGSAEYQDVLGKMQATAGAVNVQKIERVQNPHLYQSYMVRKQKMDKDNGGNSERQLFHGTDGKNISHINTQGFNRSFCGAHGTSFGRGVYFARDANYSVGYAGAGAGARYMYLAKALVGNYCRGNNSMIVPPPKDPSRPEILYDSVVNHMGNPGIFVVFFDNQCYPEYLITF